MMQKNKYMIRKKNTKEGTTRQLNLKLSKKLVDHLEIYANSFGYSNIQELIREAIRDKLFGSDKLRADYVERLLTDEDYLTSIGEEKSLEELEDLKSRI